MNRSLAYSLLFGLTAVAVPQAAADTSPADLATRAREVLRRHCLPCHGAQPKGGVRLPEHAITTGPRPLILPHRPEASLLIDLVEGGSMPPGDRPKVPRADREALRAWVLAGAPAFPAELGRNFLARAVLDDFARLKGEAKRHARYLSLNHLPESERPEWLKLLGQMMAQFGESASGIDPVRVDAAGTLLRIDLSKLGWQRQPYQGEALNLFDLLLLEYPYAALPADGPLRGELDRYVKATGQARPVPYVRADWLVRTLARPVLRGDFLAVLNKTDNTVAPPAPAGWEELDQARALRELEADPGDPRAVAALKSLLSGGKVQRAVWERHFGPLTRRLGLVPVVPLDGLTFPDYAPPGAPTVELRLIEPVSKGDVPADPSPRRRFVAGKDKFQFWVRSSEDLVVRVVYADANGWMSDVGGPTHVRARDPVLLKGGKGGPLALSFSKTDFEGKEHAASITLYARLRPASQRDYPQSKLLPPDKVAGRLLHSLDDDTDRMLKLTVPLTWVKP